MKRSRKARALLLLPIGILAVAVFGLVVSAVWNAIMPDLVGWKTIGFWQALGLFVLCRLLIGGFGGGGRGGRRGHRHLRRRWASMTPEERDRFREALRARFGDVEPPPKPSA